MFRDALFKTFVMLVLYFTVGSVCFLYRETLRLSTILFALSLLALAVSLAFGGFGFVAPAALPYAILWLAFKLPIRHFDAAGDFSYGTYLYAFPVQQGLALLRVQDHGYASYLACSLIVTAIFAVVSYHWIEAPCLKWKGVNIPAILRTRTSLPPATALGNRRPDNGPSSRQFRVTSPIIGGVSCNQRDTV